MKILSVVVPTKNRENTAVVTIANLARLQGNDLEIIVQDCGRTAVLGDRLAASVADSRVSYQHNSGASSMTDNWNLAIARATGKYVLLIGDDDAVSQHAIDAARWAHASSLDALISRPAMYWWPDYGNRMRAGWLFLPSCGGTVRLTNPQDELRHTMRLGTLSLSGLPQIYHGFVKRSLLNEVRALTGNFVNTNMPDFYGAWAISSLSNSCAEIDYPLTILGYCALSNTGRIRLGNLHEHFHEYDARESLTNTRKRIRPVDLEIHLYAAMGQALTDMGTSHLLRLFPEARIYGPQIVTNLSRAFWTYRDFRAAPLPAGQSARTLDGITQLLSFATRSTMQRLRSRLIEMLPTAAFRMRGYYTTKALTVDDAASKQSAYLSSRRVGPCLDLSTATPTVG